jgi:hypothetical protein
MKNTNSLSIKAQFGAIEIELKRETVQEAVEKLSESAATEDDLFGNECEGMCGV